MSGSTPKGMIDEKTRRMAAARHEAGHVVVALMLGRNVVDVVLDKPAGTTGRAQIHDGPDRILKMNVRSHRKVFEKSIMTLVAGRFAEAQYYGSEQPLFNPKSNTHRIDYDEIDELFTAAGYDAYERVDWLQHCETEVRNLLARSDVAQVVKRIAIELEHKRYMTRAEIDVINNALPYNPPTSRWVLPNR